MKLRDVFVFPDIQSEILKCGDDHDDKIVVVSIIGKSALSAKGLKLKCLGRMFTSPKNRKKDLTIEGYYDKSSKVLYLHVHTLLDADNFVRFMEKMGEDDNIFTIHEQAKMTFFKALFFVLHLSHLVILISPGTSFDVNYLHYFKAIENYRSKNFEIYSKMYEGCENVSKGWKSSSRMATPRLILYMEKGPSGIGNIKKYEHNLEDKVYQSMTKWNLINKNRNKSGQLFSIPLNEEFVFVSDEKEIDELGEAVRSLINSCQPDVGLQIEPPYCSESNNPHNFKSFLNQHIKQAKSKNLDDSNNHFELPTLLQWLEVSVFIYKKVMDFKELDVVCTESAYSETRCKKALPLCMGRYEEGLPPRYTTKVHNSRIEHALALFNAQARGPKSAFYKERLLEECLKYWENGRQMCEELSLTNNPCTLPKNHSEDQKHFSGVKYVAACDCGGKQGSRDDPYNIKDANFNFYQSISKECGCLSRDRINFPVSKDECLPGMITKSSPPGFLPEYSSWSLVCFGPGSLYSHNLGLSENYHPGFWSMTNYLLPWDVVIHGKSHPSMSLDDQLDEGGPMKKRDVRPMKWTSQFVVKLFIGYDYECPRGHRFMMAAPDKILKASPGSIVKDKGQKVAESDMPIYFPCVCTRGPKNMMAQLTRLHVVTPKAAVNVKVYPKVQPGPNAPVFLPTLTGPAKLTQAAYWIVRLPYIYYTDQTVYSENHSAKLLAGVFSVSKIE